MSFVDRTSGPDMYDDCDKMIKDSHEQVSAMIASELNNLSSVERATVLDDVHGVGELPQEERNPALLQQKLLELDAALRSIPAKAAFDEAQRLSGGNGGGMVNDPSFRVRFLRAARYDPKAAAVRIVGNLELIREHFGLECLVRPIFLSDMMLDAENQGIESFLFSGDKFQILPFRDRLGRRIVIRSGKKVFDEHIDIRTRVSVWYDYTHGIAVLIVTRVSKQSSPNRLYNPSTGMFWSICSDKNPPICLPRVVE